MFCAFKRLTFSLFHLSTFSHSNVCVYLCSSVVSFRFIVIFFPDYELSKVLAEENNIEKQIDSGAFHKTGIFRRGSDCALSDGKSARKFNRITKSISRRSEIRAKT
jgi:hypothetical protein